MEFGQLPHRKLPVAVGTFEDLLSESTAHLCFVLGSKPAAASETTEKMSDCHSSYAAAFVVNASSIGKSRASQRRLSDTADGAELPLRIFTTVAGEMFPALLAIL